GVLSLIQCDVKYAIMGAEDISSCANCSRMQAQLDARRAQLEAQQAQLEVLQLDFVPHAADAKLGIKASRSSLGNWIRSLLSSDPVLIRACQIRTRIRRRQSEDVGSSLAYHAVSSADNRPAS